MNMYQEIIFLKSWFKGKWVVENVKPYYEPLIKPTIILGRHSIWSNFSIPNKEFNNIDLSRSNKEQLAKDLGMPVTKRLYLRNCVKPELALHIFKATHKTGCEKQ